jgi:ubiquinone/menaquinone biosynthesis C-methylase UbiE
VSVAAEERVRHPIAARLIERTMRAAEKRGQAEYRRQLLAGLSGRVVEVGAGSGINFRHYPKSVTEVVAVEPEAYLRRLAEQAAATAPIPVRVVSGVAGNLPLEDASFDAAVSCLVLCSVHDQRRALDELARVIQPGGELRFYEHVVSQRPLGAALQRFGDATYWPLLAGGCQRSRDTGRVIEEAGFRIERSDRFPFSPGPLLPADPHILGVARRA